jgi:hypothetical protein
MRPKGSGTFQVEGPGMSASGYIIAGQYILSSDAVYARNGYDTRILKWCFVTLCSTHRRQHITFTFIVSSSVHCGIGSEPSF